MKRYFFLFLAGIASLTFAGDAGGRGGGGGARGGSFSGSASHSEGASFSSFSGSDRSGGSYSGSRSASSSAGYDSRGASGSYDHTWDSAAGGSVSTSGSRSAEQGRYGGTAASSSRDTTVTTASGKTYSNSRDAAAASGPMGRTVGGVSDTARSPTGSASYNSAFAGNRYTGNMAGYTSLSASGAHGTAYWSGGAMTTHATSVRSGFGYYDAFHPAWYTAHPGCWAAAGWAAGAAWTAAPYAAVSDYCGLAAASAPDYDYGSSVVVQDNEVSMNGTSVCTAQQFADQATTIATAGQTAAAPTTDEWKSLGVFALAQVGEATSNNIFQLAVNKAGIIRGNYYDGLMDTTTEVYGSIDKSTQRAAWTIGKKKDRVFEAGVFNLTQEQCPCLIHFGTEKTTQMLLVRVQQPSGK
ncbi:hypothetical protein BH11PLA2_BH11PLA2_46550 [soil metagenome]